MPCMIIMTHDKGLWNLHLFNMNSKTASRVAEEEFFRLPTAGCKHYRESSNAFGVLSLNMNSSGTLINFTNQLERYSGQLVSDNWPVSWNEKCLQSLQCSVQWTLSNYKEFKFEFVGKEQVGLILPTGTWSRAHFCSTLSLQTRNGFFLQHSYYEFHKQCLLNIQKHKFCLTTKCSLPSSW